MSDPLTRDTERARFDLRPGLSAWQRMCPSDAWRDDPLPALEAYLDQEDTTAEIEDCERTGRYPRQVLEGLRERGWTRLLAEVPREQSLVTVYHLASLNALAARRNTSVAITAGVHALSLLPAYVGADADQRAAIFARVRQGAGCSMLRADPRGARAPGGVALRAAAA